MSDWPRVWVVVGSQGEYSDRREWPVCAYPDEAAARRHVEAAAARAREILELANRLLTSPEPASHRLYDDVEEAEEREPGSAPEARSEWDPEPERSLWQAYDEAEYFLYEVDLRDASAAP